MSTAPMYVGDGDGEDGYEDYGSTGGLHASMMGALWSPCANIAIILIIYSYRKYWVWVHMAYFTFATIITLVSSIPIWFYTGLIPRDSPIVYDDYSAGTLNTHYILGMVCCGLVVIASLIGVLTKVLNICNARSVTIIWVRRIHTWFSYVTVWACKVNCYIMSLGTWLAIDIVSTIIYVVWRLMFPKLEERGITPKYEEVIPSVKSFHDLDQSKTYIVFANKIYDIQPLRYNHPAGYQIC